MVPSVDTVHEALGDQIRIGPPAATIEDRPASIVTRVSTRLDPGRQRTILAESLSRRLEKTISSP
jgi:hypothetical protein